MARSSVVAGPDTGTVKQDDDLLAAAAQAAPEPPAPREPELDPRDRELLELRAANLQMQAQLAARPGEQPRGAAAADAGAIRFTGEKTFRTEFPMHAGVELGDGLHQRFIAETASRAAAEGWTTRGGAWRSGRGTDKDGTPTVVYEIYARKN